MGGLSASLVGGLLLTRPHRVPPVGVLVSSHKYTSPHFTLITCLKD